MFTILNNTINSILPDGITIGENSYGHALFSTKSFHKGEILYTGHMLLVNEDEILNEYNLHIINNDTTNNYTLNKYILNKYKHFVKIGNQRQVYGFDAFMNHSCNPTTICNNISDLSYEVIAFRDINVGDEITCDYALFDYECNGHEISKCECGEENCRGSMNGFVNLPLETQLNLLPNVDNVIFDKFVSDHKLINVGKIICPDCCEICESEKTYFKLISKKNFQIGEIIYENESIIIERNNTHQRILYSLNNKYYIAHSELYIIRTNYREFLGFDSFMNHSCDPNTEMIYSGLNKYKMIATKNICVGDDLTCDYEKLNNNCNNFENKYVVTCVFDCNCKSSICKKVISS